jgi:hypothetical protein
MYHVPDSRGCHWAGSHTPVGRRSSLAWKNAQSGTRFGCAPNRIHVPLESFYFEHRRVNLGHVQPLHNHHKPAVEHRLVRRPDAPAAKHLHRRTHHLLEAVARRLTGVECEAPTPLQPHRQRWRGWRHRRGGGQGRGRGWVGCARVWGRVRAC